jgi:glyoxylase-like metal-dependent hydrolase (beta-lactamase superfamily II)
MHHADQFMLGGPEAHLASPNDAAALLRLLGRDDLIAEREVVLRKVVGASSGVEHALDDGDTVDLGGEVRLRVTHTPGHTNGSVTFFLENEGVLFTGDAVQGHGWRAGMAPLYYDAEYVRSLDRIEALGARTLCMGHTFGWAGVSNESVRRGPAVAETLSASRRASSAIDAAVDVSQRAQMSIQPEIKAFQKKFKGDREGMARAQMALYKERGINPAAGCLPLLIQMPILFGMYAAMSQLATTGLTLDQVITNQIQNGQVVYAAQRTETPWHSSATEPAPVSRFSPRPRFASSPLSCRCCSTAAPSCPPRPRQRSAPTSRRGAAAPEGTGGSPRRRRRSCGPPPASER